LVNRRVLIYFAGMRFWSFGVLVAICACGGQTAPVATTTAHAPPRSSGTGKILSFAVAQDSLRADKVGLRDGSLKPDGSVDLDFTVQLEGPIDSLFIISCDEQGAPYGGFRANTLIGNQESPPELGGALELGRLSTGIGVEENGKFINLQNGSMPVLYDRHDLNLYVPNTNALRDGFIRVYGRQPDGTLVKGPIVRY